MLVLLFVLAILFTVETATGQVPFQCAAPESFICTNEVAKLQYDVFRCDDGPNYDPACLGGFFDSLYNNSQPNGGDVYGDLVACCPGFYCSRTTACMQPCSQGGTCLPSYSLERNCTPFYTETEQNGIKLCGGAPIDAPCREGYYCSSPNSVPEVCPVEHYCSIASDTPTRCSSIFGKHSIDYCPAATTSNQTIGMSWFCCGIVLGALFLLWCWKEDIAEYLFNSIPADTPPTPKNPVNIDSPPTQKNTLKIEKITITEVKVWRKNKLSFALDVNGEHLVLHPGVTALIGLSGVGKSTLFDTLSGNILSSHALTAQIDYTLPNAPPISERYQSFFKNYGNRIAYVCQKDIMHEPLTVWETVMFNARMRTSFGQAECAKITKFWLTKLKLMGPKTDKAHLKLTSTLSGGMKKRVNVAMELVTDPMILILDEPTSGLDTMSTELLLRLLKEFAIPTRASSTGAREADPDGIQRVVLAVLHQPSYEVAQQFSNILGVRGRIMYCPGNKEERIGTLELPQLTLALLPAYLQKADQEQLKEKKLVVMHRLNILDTFVLSLARRPRQGSELDKELQSKLKKKANEKEPWFSFFRWLPKHDLSNSTEHSLVGYTNTFFNQAYHSTMRALVLLIHNFSQYLLNVLLSISLGFALGFFNKDMDVAKVPPAAFLLVLCTSLVCLQTGVQMRVNNKLASLREGQRGVHTIAVYLGETLVELLWLVIAPACILLFFFAYAKPRGPFSMYYRVLLGVSFTAASLGHALAESIDQPGVFGIYGNLFLALLSGFSPPKTQLPDGLTNISFMSFSFYALVEGEYHTYPEVLQPFAQYALAQSLEVCSFLPSAGRDMPNTIDSCPLDCDYYCVQDYILQCVAYGFAFRLMVVLAQLFQFVVMPTELASNFYNRHIKPRLCFYCQKNEPVAEVVLSASSSPVLNVDSIGSM